jgi:hypothetical protein
MPGPLAYGAGPSRLQKPVRLKIIAIASRLCLRTALVDAGGIRCFVCWQSFAIARDAQSHLSLADPSNRYRLLRAKSVGVQHSLLSGAEPLSSAILCWANRLARTVMGLRCYQIRVKSGLASFSKGRETRNRREQKPRS